MVALLLALGMPPAFAPPQPWALGTGAPPRLPFVGDVDADGFADLVAVYPPGACILDVGPSVAGQKSAPGFQALTNWGKECQAAAVGTIDATPGADVVGIFDGKTLRLAGSLQKRKFQDTPDWVELPAPLAAPAVAVLDGGKALLAFSTQDGRAFRIDSAARKAAEVRVPKGTLWIGDAGSTLICESARGEIHLLDPESLKIGARIGTARKGSRPAAGPGFATWDDTLWTPEGTTQLAADGLPPAPTAAAIGDVDGDGDLDLVSFRYGSEKHTRNEVFLRRALTPGETDFDHDGLDNTQEQALGTDPLNPDTDGDGLLDGWETGTFRDLDLKGLGCDPNHLDAICLISRFETVKEDLVKSQFELVDKFYTTLKIQNPDGKDGIRFHPIFLDPVTGDDLNNGWRENRAKFLPPKWQGVVHWMQVTPGGGGQADQLGNGGTVGQNALWAVFVHEFGHQMGLDHEGFWPNNLCPTYPSLMNYAYSYSFEDSGNKIHYSDGSLADYVLNETDLDETIPLPYDRVKFLEKGPYHFRLKPNGDTTLIDWNWNGVFGEKHIRADINYSYSTNAGRRDDVAKIETAPWLFVHDGGAFALYGDSPVLAKGSKDPTIGPDQPGRLVLQRLQKPYAWDKPVVLAPEGLVGDPVAASFAGKIRVFYQTAQGVVMQNVIVKASQLAPEEPQVIDPNPDLVPTVGVSGGRLFLFLWNPVNGAVDYKVMERDGTFVRTLGLFLQSTNPVGMCTDTLTGELVLALAQDQDPQRPKRWQIRRFEDQSGRLRERSMEWVEGEKGQCRGTGRLTVLFDASRDAGPKGRLYVYGKGFTAGPNDPSCTYVAHQIADSSIGGGWMVKRFYDEWTQSRSAPAAAWFGGDVIWGYRWVGGSNDDMLHVGYGGLGIQSAPMADHDDIGFLHDFGIRHSVLWLSN
ncbi:MAG: hypothetical protein H6534_08090 [Chthonomonadaceae bacterium]|nr:hypothetical protein [Chthonomonadaceae bacterium]